MNLFLMKITYYFATPTPVVVPGCSWSRRTTFRSRCCEPIGFLVMYAEDLLADGQPRNGRRPHLQFYHDDLLLIVYWQ